MCAGGRTNALKSQTHAVSPLGCAPMHHALHEPFKPLVSAEIAAAAEQVLEPPVGSAQWTTLHEVPQPSPFECPILRVQQLLLACQEVPGFNGLRVCLGLHRL